MMIVKTLFKNVFLAHFIQISLAKVVFPIPMYILTTKVKA